MWYGMSNMKALYLSIFVFTVFTVGTSSVAAQLDVNEMKANQQRMERLKDDEAVKSQIDAVKAQQAIQKKEQLQKRCETQERVLTQYQERFDKNAQGYSTRFQTYHDKVAALVEKLSANEEINTAPLTAHLITLQTMITGFAEQQPEFKAQIGTMQSAACSDGATEYRTAMQGAQNTFRSMRSETEQIRLFIQNTIRPELVVLRQQLASLNGQ